MKSKIEIRPARVDETSDLLFFIRALAEYEKLSDQVVATEETLKATLFGPQKCSAEVIFLTVDEKKMGFALFFQSYSTFLAKPGIYLEDLFVLPEARGQGYGKRLLAHLAKLAIDRNCGRLEWSVLDWNTPAIEFYKSLGAQMMSEWTMNRLNGDSLKNLAQLDFSDLKNLNEGK